eukprot:5916546-Amphidinium_carterae.1
MSRRGPKQHQCLQYWGLLHASPTVPRHMDCCHDGPFSTRRHLLRFQTGGGLARCQGPWSGPGVTMPCFSDGGGPMSGGHRHNAGQDASPFMDGRLSDPRTQLPSFRGGGGDGSGGKGTGKSKPSSDATDAKSGRIKKVLQ